MKITPKFFKITSSAKLVKITHPPNILLLSQNLNKIDAFCTIKKCHSSKTQLEIANFSDYVFLVIFIKFGFSTEYSSA